MAIDVAAVSPVSGGRIRRAWHRARRSFYPVSGPFTSVVLTDDGSGSLAYMPVTERTALSIAAVYRALAVYADSLGTLPVQRIRGDAEQLAPAPFVERPAGTPTGWTDEIGQIVWSLLLRGNAYLIVTALDWTGYPAAFYVVNPDAMSISRRPSGQIEYRLYNAGGDDLVYVDPHPDELLHLRWQRPPGAYCGVGILDSAGGPGGVLAGAWSAEHYAADLMANPIPASVLEHPMRLDAGQATQLQTQWAESVGRGRAVPAVLSGGIKYQALSVTPRDVQLIESRRWNATQIATLFGLPPYELGGSVGDSLTYSTVEGEQMRKWVNALQPMAVRIERAIGGAWLPAGQRIRFVPDAVLRPQTLDRYQAHEIALRAGFATVDEVRSLENRPPLPEASAPPPAPEPETPEVTNG